MANKTFNFKDRVPDILLESFFIVAALLLAFALDEWREEKEKQEIADKAKTAIYSELSDNLDKLQRNLPVHEERLGDLKNIIQAMENTPEEDSELGFEYSMVLISSAAWESAKMTQVVQNFTFEEITDFSQLYQMQDLYTDNQDKIIDKVMEMGDLDEDELLGIMKRLSHRLEILIDINKDYSRALESVIPTTTSTE